MTNLLEVGYRPAITQIGGKAFETLSPHEDTSYLLEGTGLPIKTETDILENLLYENIGQKPYLSIIDDWLTITGENFFHFSREHVQGRPLLGFLYAINGNNRLVAPKSLNAVIADVSSFDERYGSQKKAIIGDPIEGDEGFESFLNHAPVGSIVARTSPPGWSGYPGYTYAEAQTQLMIKVEENNEIKIKGFNLRTLTNVKQNEDFLKNLGVSEQRLGKWTTENERLANVTGINVYFHRDTNPKTIEELAEELHKIAGDEVFNNHSFQDIKNDMQRFDELINMDVEAIDRMNIVKNYTITELMRVHEEVIKTRQIPKDALTNLQKVYGTMVLDFWMKIKHGSKPIRVDDPNVTLSHAYSDNPIVGVGGDRYGNALKELRQASGCPGVQSKGLDQYQDPTIVLLENIFGVISAQFDPLEVNNGFCPEIKCGREGCGWKPKTEAQAKEVGKSIRNCPDCGWKPGDSTAPLINIDPEAKQNKMTVFENKKDTYKQAKNNIFNKSVIRKEESADTEKKHSITLFWGPSVKLKKIDEEKK
ncbi:MAG TPA: hypothetical protein VLG12_04340 [Candidatus Saccharimonadales bacterium]|nr:hypothetical protein [Candidatus Saccharimonadales bacterium]